MINYKSPIKIGLFSFYRLHLKFRVCYNKFNIMEVYDEEK
jgi:hypothetical protein